MSIEKTIKGLRKSLCLEQVEFAKLLGVSKASVCYYEKGTRTPRLSIVRKMIELANKNKIKISVNNFFK